VPDEHPVATTVHIAGRSVRPAGLTCARFSAPQLTRKDATQLWPSLVRLGSCHVRRMCALGAIGGGARRLPQAPSPWPSWSTTGTSSARLLLAQVFAILQQRGKTEVVAEVDVTNTSSNRLLTGLGAHRTGGTIELPE
jgi:hypothetical protein